jgi:hypothetical protein
MSDFKKTEFVSTGNELHFGPGYGNYWALEIRHTGKGTTADVLLGADGNLVQHANDITDLIRANFKLDNRSAKIIPMSIDGIGMLVIALPKI